MKRNLLITLLATVATVACVLGLTACNPDQSGEDTNSPHTHEWSLTYTVDGNRHYQTCSGCDEKNYEEHSYTNGICVCGKAEPVHGTTGLTYELNDDGNSYSVTGIGSATAKEIVISSAYEGLPVSTIAYAAFKECSFITDITIPDSITEIGVSSFSSCTALKNVNIPDSVITIRNSAFYGCTSLTNINIPDSVTAIEDAAFAYSGLESVNVPGSVGSVSDYAFQSCKSLKNVIISNGVTSIGAYALNGCSKLKSVTIPAVREIGETALYGCYNLTTVIFNGTVTEWDAIKISEDWNGFTEDFMIKCTNGVLDKNGTELIPSDGLEYTLSDNGNYYTCTGIGTATYTDIVIANEYNGKPVTAISDNAFEYGNLTSVKILYGITSIGAYAFGGCENLVSIKVPDTVATIGDFAFGGCENLETVNIPDGITAIGERVFSGCISLSKITIPSSVTSIGEGAFEYCEFPIMYYVGTEEEWQAVEKAETWNDGATFSVFFIDG